MSKKASNIKEYRTCGEYHPIGRAQRQAWGLFPHHLWKSNEGEEHSRAILVTRRTKGKLHWSVSEAAIFFVHGAQYDRGTIKRGYLAFEEQNGTVVEIVTIAEVLAKIKPHPPNLGTQYGNYYYLDTDLNVYPAGAFSTEDVL